MKVMRIIARLNVGGPSIHVTLLSKGLKPDFETLLVCGKESEHEGSMAYYAMEKGVQPLVLEGLGREIHPLKDIAVVWQLYRLMKTERPTIVHTHTAKAGAVGRLAAKLAGVPIVVHTFHGHVFHSYFSPLKTKVFLWIERMLARWTDRIVVLSQLQKQEILNLGVCDEARMAIVPLGLDFERMQPTQDLRAVWDVPPNKKVIGIVGRLAPIKNHDMFLRVAKAFADDPNVLFVVVGDGERGGELKDMARDLCNVRFVGWEKDIASVYEALDVVALTSRNEGTPLSIIEAMISGKAVVATDVGGVKDIVEHGETGFVVPVDDDAAMIRALRKVLDDPELRQTMGSKAQTAARARFSSERLIADVRALYQEILRDSDNRRKKAMANTPSGFIGSDGVEC